MSRLRKKLEDKANVTIVVYVHGWKHNAEFNDSNVIQFRKILQGVRATELITETPRDVVGIYVGWRGRSLDVPEPLLNVTFWTRKEAASRVAQGSVRELFSRLTGFQRHHNGLDKDCKPSKTVTRPRCDIRMLLIGHSFGAWVLYSAINESLIEGIAAERDIGDESRAAARFADMVVLINPAFEGSRYESLHRAARERKDIKYQAPIFVSVTSSADWATGLAFPAGRLLSTVFQRPVSSSDQSEAISNTLGHIDRYTTHDLTKSEQSTTECGNWRDATNMKGEERMAQLKANVLAEERNEKAFFGSQLDNEALKPGWTRKFCGGAVLTHLATQDVRSNPNSPVWMVRADKSIISGHNDIADVAFTSFVRQLYHDVTMHPFAFRFR